MTRLIVTQAGREKSFDLIDDVIFLGRAEDCAIRIDGDDVDERHCQVLKVDGRYRVMNLGSSGTRVNGQSVTQHELSNGDVIQIGAVAIAFRGGVVPDAPAAPAAEPEPVAAPQTSSSGSGRPRRRGARGRRGGKEVHVAGNMRQAASQREVLTRQRVRKSGLSGPATIGIATAVSIVVIVFAWFVIRNIGADEWGDKLIRAKAYIAQSKYDEARALLEQIPPEASNYRFAQAELESMDLRVTAGVDLKLHQHGEADYQSNILYFIQQKIETDNEKYKGDMAYVRVIVKRMEKFLQEFKGHQREPEVKSFLAKYKALVPTGPLTWHDVAVDADVERARSMFGPAYKSVTDWIAAHPNADEFELKQAGQLRDKIVRGANYWWNDQDSRAKANIADDHISDAYAKYLTAVRRLEGMPQLFSKAETMATRLKERAGEMIVEK